MGASGGSRPNNIRTEHKIYTCLGFWNLKIYPVVQKLAFISS